MDDYIEIKKIYEDEHLLEFKVICCSNLIKAETKIYETKESIDDLFFKIKNFIYKKNSECFWCCTEEENDKLIYFSLKIFNKDKLGHVLIEVYMVLEDGGNFDTHNCCFYVNTEIGLLEEFCNKLLLLKEEPCGISVKLNSI